MKARLDHVGIAVKNLDQALAFYRDALGLQIEPPEGIPSQRVRAHFVPVGEASLELLESAADDSVMPQTREHLALLELLGVRRGVVAITKCDLADDEQLEIVEMEVAELIAPTFLCNAPHIRVSVKSGLVSVTSDLRPGLR